MPALIRKCPPWSQHRQLCLEIQTQSKLIKARRRRWGFLLIRTIVSSFTASNLQRLYDWEPPWKFLEPKPLWQSKDLFMIIFFLLSRFFMVFLMTCPARTRYSSVTWMLLQARALSSLSLTHSCGWVVASNDSWCNMSKVFLSHNKLVFKLTKFDKDW